jgi:cyclic di-GMP phosphodiesterase Gmr
MGTDAQSAQSLALATVEATAALVVVCDGDGRIQLANPSLQRFCGRPADALVGRHFWDVVVVPEEVELARRALADVMAGRAFFPHEVDWLAASGERRRVELQSSVLRDPAGRAYAVSWVGLDVTEERLRQAAVEHRAATDTLTGVGNRSALFDALRRRLDQQSGVGCGLLFCDLDGFKAVNDAHGHLVGDRLLAEVAGRLVELAGETGSVVRFGGDEFVVLCPPAGPEVMAERAEQIGRRLREPIDTPAGPLSIGVSVGAAVGRPGDCPDEVVARADEQMYGVKVRSRAR